MKQNMKSICLRSSLLVFALFIICLSGIPVNADTNHKFVDISAGSSYLALRDDGTVWTWGLMYCAEYKVDNPEIPDYPYDMTWDQPVPAKVNISNVVAVSTGSSNSLALKDDGTVWAWGYNRFGNLGDGTNVSTPKGSLTPVQVVGLYNITAICASGNACLALRNDGTVWSWGYNTNGDLGDGTYTNSLVPVQVTGLTDITMIGPGFAVNGNGIVYAWGDTLFSPDEAKNFTNSSIPGKNIPFQVQGVNNVSAMSSNGYDHTEFVKNGSVWGWGLDMNGQLGDGTNINMNPSYVAVPSKPWVWIMLPPYR